MNFIALIPSDLQHFLSGFTKKRYPGCFADYCRMAEPELVSALRSGSPESQAQQLVAWMDSQVKGFFQKRKRFDQQLLLMEYTIPAAIRCGQRTFAEALQSTWNTAHPDFAFGVATYEEFYADFNQTLLGFKIEREDKQ
ncbi:MAG: hypothetical protein ACI3XG_03375 [Faecousia sp.]